MSLKGTLITIAMISSLIIISVMLIISVSKARKELQLQKDILELNKNRCLKLDGEPLMINNELKCFNSNGIIDIRVDRSL